MSDQNVQRPEPLGMDNAFAYDTMSRRVPGIIRQIQDVNPDYPASIMQALDRLHDDMKANAPIPMIDNAPIPTLDYATWEAGYQTHAAKFQPYTWLNNTWFFAEVFLYRHIMQAVRWFETGRDPFIAIKREELGADRLWQLVDVALDVRGTFDEKLTLLAGFALWGNRVDLSHPAGTLAADAAEDDDLLVDDRAALVRHMVANDSPRCDGAVHIVADNTGTELAIDLVLADMLLAADVQQVVALHVKWHPTFVSDATVDDVWQMIGAMEAHEGKFAALAGRLRAAWLAGRFRIGSHPFWNSGSFLWEMPSTLKQAFSTARLVIFKGDINYRRAVGDTIWPSGVTYADAMSYFPAPVLALRSLKSDGLVGVPAERTDPLDATDSNWRTTGRYGLMQFANRED